VLYGYSDLCSWAFLGLADCFAFSTSGLAGCLVWLVLGVVGSCLLSPRGSLRLRSIDMRRSSSSCSSLLGS